MGEQPRLRAVAVSILMLAVAAPPSQAAGGAGGAGGYDVETPGGLGGVTPAQAGQDGRDLFGYNGTGGGGGARGGAGGRGGMDLTASGQALAAGGAAGNGTVGNGANGADGTFDGGMLTGGGGGGGGGGADTLVTSGPATSLLTAIVGGHGGNGGNGGSPMNNPGDAMGAGGGGGAGGYGVIFSGGAMYIATGVGVSGGNGGNGGIGGGSKGIANFHGAGNGGDGGVGLSFTGATAMTIEAGAGVSGGNGGNGGQGGNAVYGDFAGAGGNGGRGGTAIELAPGSTLLNMGIVRGGAGGAAGAGGVNYDGTIAAGGVAGLAGVGVRGQDIIIVNKGSIYQTGSTPAVEFTGGTNRFEYWTTSYASSIAANGGDDTLVLAGDTGNGTIPFDVSNFGTNFRGFEHFEKTGTSEWMLYGTTTAQTNWVIKGGVLSVASDATLGAAASTLTLDGGTLRATGSLLRSRPTAIGAGGGTFDIVSGMLTHDGEISGTGSLTKTGNGTLTLNAINPYAGGTQVLGGVMVANVNGGIGSGALTVDGYGTVYLNNGFDLGGRQITNRAGYIHVRDGTLGDAQVTNLGGYTYLLGNATAANATIVNNGGIMSFQEGSTAANSRITTRAGSLTEFWGWSTGGNASLTTDAGGTVDFSGTSGPAGDHRLGAGAIAGAGRFRLGANTLTVGGDNTSTTVSGTIEDGGAGGGVGGGLVKAGSGTLTLSGANTYTGATQVNAGTLTVNGSIAGPVTVGLGATLGGTGSVGSTVVSGTLAPGNSVGTLTVNGDLTLAPGSTYRVEADPASGASDLVVVTNRATLGGSVVHVGPDGNFASTRRYTILTAGQVAGTFASVSSNYAFLRPTIEYQTNAVTLELTRKDIDVPVPPTQPGTGNGDTPGVTPGGNTGGGTTRPMRFADAAVTSNQRAVANALETLADSNALHEAVVTLPEGAPPAAFNSLSGEAHASTVAGLMTVSGGARTLPLAHLHDSLSAGLLPGAPIAQIGGPLPAAALPISAAQPLWVEVLGNWQTLNGDGNAARMRQQTGGFYLGGDGVVASNWRLGGAFGYATSTLRVNDRSSRAITDTFSATLYGGRAFALGGGKLKWLFGTAYSWHDADTDRQVNVSGMPAQSLSASYHGSTTQLFTEAGFAWPLSATTQLEPYAGVAWSDTRTRGFAETGGSAALHSPGDRNTLTTTTLGLRGSMRFQFGGTEAALHAGAGWRHAFGDIRPATTLAFDGSQAFTVTGAPIAQNAAVAELRGDFAISRTATLSLRYSGQFGDGNQDHTGMVGLRWRF